MSEDDFESIGSLVTEMNGEDLAAIQSNVSIRRHFFQFVAQPQCICRRSNSNRLIVVIRDFFNNNKWRMAM